MCIYVRVDIYLYTSIYAASTKFHSRTMNENASTKGARVYSNITHAAMRICMYMCCVVCLWTYSIRTVNENNYIYNAHSSTFIFVVIVEFYTWKWMHKCQCDMVDSCIQFLVLRNTEYMYSTHNRCICI